MSNLPPEGYTSSKLTLEALATLQTIQIQVEAGQKDWADAYQSIIDNMPQGYSSGGIFWFEGAIGVNARTGAGSTLSSDYIKYYYRTVAALYDYDITLEKFRRATDRIGEGVTGGIINSGGFLPEVEHIIKIDALEGTRILGLPDHHWAGTFVATWGLGVDTFSLGGELTLPDTPQIDIWGGGGTDGGDIIMGGLTRTG